MSTSISVATSPIDVNSVGDSWKQENASSYIWTRMPMALCRGRRVGNTGVTTYEISDLDNFMLKNDLMDWDPGNPSPPSRSLNSTTVTLTSRGKAAPDRFDRPLDRPTQHRMADLERNLVPGQYSLLYQGIEKACLSNIFSTSFGSAQNWNAGGNVLDEISSSINPILDIEAALLPLRKYIRPGFQLEAVLDRRVLHLLAQYVEYTGAGLGSNSASMLPTDALVQRLKDIHGIAEVHIVSTTRDSVDLGQTSSLTEMGAGGFAIGIFDRRMSRFDLTDQESTDAPDGAFVIGFDREPYVKVWEDPNGGELEYFHARASFGVTNPRGATFGVYWPASANFT